MAVDSTALCSLAAVKAIIHNESTTSDSLIESIINAVSPDIELELERSFTQATKTEYYNGDGSRLLLLRNWPVVSITSIHNSSDDPPVFDSTTLEDSTYYSSDDAIMPGGVYFRDSILYRGFKNVKAIYVAGYDRGSGPGESDDELPKDLQFAVARHCAKIFKRLNQDGIQQFSTDGGNAVLVKGYEKEVRRTLYRYSGKDAI